MLKKDQGKIIWLYGRPCSGKSTIATGIATALEEKGIPVITLDGDELRKGINHDLGYSLVDRFENIRRAAEIAEMLAGKGFWVVCSFVTPTRELRELVTKINSELDLHLIYIHASLGACKQRDVKGHYLKAQTSQLHDFTGISSPFEEPEKSNKWINTHELDIQQSCKNCLDFIFDTSKIKN